MKVFQWDTIKASCTSDSIDEFFKSGTGISIGSFDGLHKGHRVLLHTLVNGCKKNNFKSGVVSFTRPLPSFKHSESYAGDLTTLNQRLKLFESVGIDFVIVVDFNEEFASTKGTDFLQMLMNICNMKYIVEGVDFRCGYKGATDITSIKYFSENHGVKYDFVEPVYYTSGSETERISSSFIRTMVLKRFLSTAAELLERPYSIDFTFENGCKKVLQNEIKQAIPPSGIYHCKYETSSKTGDVRLEVTDLEILFSFDEAVTDEKQVTVIFE